jgi:hypothetical protein
MLQLEHVLCQYWYLFHNTLNFNDKFYLTEAASQVLSGECKKSRQKCPFCHRARLTPRRFPFAPSALSLLCSSTPWV